MIRKLKKIALINPSTYSNSEIHMYEMYKRNKKNYKPYLSPPLNLITLASITPQEVEIKIIDEHIEKIDFNEKFDLVGITAMSQQAFRAYKIAREFKRKNIPVVMGGIHASVLPDEALKYVDTVIIGEAEEQWSNYLRDLKKGKEKRIYQNSNFLNLENIPIPKYDLLKYHQYKLNDAYTSLIPIQATRGCPRSCNFCIVPEFYGKVIRKKKISQIIKEIEYLQKLKFDSLLLFVDDNFFIDRQFSKALLKEILPLKISYVVQTDIKVANDEELLDLAYRSGCILMLIGFESTNQKSLSEINTNKWKMNQLNTYTESIKKIHEHGILVFGSFIIGFENDDLTSFGKIKDFVIKNNISGHFTILTPLPGSELYEKMKFENRFFKNSFWDNFSFYSLNFKHKNINKEKAEKEIIKLYDEIYNDDISLKRNMHMFQNFKNLKGRWA